MSTFLLCWMVLGLCGTSYLGFWNVHNYVTAEPKKSYVLYLVLALSGIVTFVYALYHLCKEEKWMKDFIVFVNGNKNVPPPLPPSPTP